MVTDDSDRDFWHRINQMYAAAGLPVVMPEEWDAINAMAEAMDRVDGKAVKRLERHPIMQAVASEMRQAFLTQSHTIEYDTRWCPEFDESKPETMSRYYAQVKGYDKLVPLSSLDQWVYVGEAVAPTRECLARIAADCYRQLEHGRLFPEDPPVMQTAVVRGEIVCIFNICGICYGYLGYLTFGDYPECSGPYPWYDDGKRVSEPDDDDLWSA